MSPNNNSILVTGVHRSGTTWVGKMLALSARTYYVGEIFRPDTQLLDARLIPNWYPYITPDVDDAVRAQVGRIVDLDFTCCSACPGRSLRTPLHPCRSNG